MPLCALLCGMEVKPENHSVQDVQPTLFEITEICSIDDEISIDAVHAKLVTQDVT